MPRRPPPRVTGYITWNTEEKAAVLKQGRIERTKDLLAPRHEILKRAQLVLPPDKRRKNISGITTAPSQPVGKWFNDEMLRSNKPLVVPLMGGAAVKAKKLAAEAAAATPPLTLRQELNHKLVERLATAPTPPLRRFFTPELLADIRSLLADAVREALGPREAPALPTAPAPAPAAPVEPPRPAAEAMALPATSAATDPRERFIENNIAAGIAREVAERIEAEHPPMNGHAAAPAEEVAEPEAKPPRHQSELPTVPRDKQPVVLVAGLKGRQAQELEFEFGNHVRLKIHANGDGPKLLRQRAESATDAIVTGWVAAPARAMLKARLGKGHVKELPPGELANGVRRVLQEHVERLAASH